MAIETASVETTLAALRDRLHGVVPEFELTIKAELAFEINRLKRERGAVILGHNYMEPALFHSVCDHVGDSLELSRVAATTEAEILIFCGVRFMAETAKILSPERTVLLPAKVAGCSLAESITAEDVRELKRRYPGVPVIAYINTYADVKAEVDVCCTSGNARQVVESFGDQTVIFLPDEYLAANVARETGKEIIFPTLGPKPAGEPANSLKHEMIGWGGRCEVHEKFTVEDIADVRRQFPDVVILTHPECSPAVVEASDFSGSTAAMSRHVREVDAPRYLLLTECSMGANIAAEAPEKEMLGLCSVRCPHMNEITLDLALASLQETRYVIEVPEEIRARARGSIDRMLEIR
ncbi:MAG: quinolinate synthase NadA [Chloroflexota bacterium]|nr:quinolinate synthase NadA [Chloroflexota bacterium]MDP6508539.1 quinolinate synthase NadA [Chloroflexota bacterium]